jgi:hypothetical protein
VETTHVTNNKIRLNNDDVKYGKQEKKRHGQCLPKGNYSNKEKSHFVPTKNAFKTEHNIPEDDKATMRMCKMKNMKDKN